MFKLFYFFGNVLAFSLRDNRYELLSCIEKNVVYFSYLRYFAVYLADPHFILADGLHTAVSEDSLSLFKYFVHFFLLNTGIY